MRDFLRWLAAFDPEKDIGEATVEAARQTHEPVAVTRVFREMVTVKTKTGRTRKIWKNVPRTFTVHCGRPDETGLVFKGLSVFQPPELEPSLKPAVDLPVDIKTFDVKCFDTDGNFVGTKKQTRVVKMSDVGSTPSWVHPSYHQSKIPLERALIRAQDAFNTFKPPECPWQGAMVGFWMTSLRLLERKGVVREDAEKLVLKTGEALIKLSRSCNDSDNLIVSDAIARISSSNDPVDTLADIANKSTLYYRQSEDFICPRCGRDAEFGIKTPCCKEIPTTKEAFMEAMSALEEFAYRQNMNVEDLMLAGAIRSPDGRLIHRRNLVRRGVITDEDGIPHVLGWTHDGEFGEILGYEDLLYHETIDASHEMAERRTDRRAKSHGRGKAPIPILLADDVQRPMRYQEASETYNEWTFTVTKIINKKKKSTHRIVIHGSGDATMNKIQRIHARLSAVPNTIVTRPTPKCYPTWRVVVTIYEKTTEFHIACHLSTVQSIGRMIQDGWLTSINDVKDFLSLDGIWTETKKKSSIPRTVRAFKAGMSNIPIKFRRTFGGSWERRDDDTMVKNHGISSQMTSMAIELEADCTIGDNPHNIQPGSYIEQEGEVTLVLPPDWLELNINRLHLADEMIEEINNLEDPRKVQDIRKRIYLMYKNRPDIQRYLRGLLRTRIRELLMAEALTPELIKTLSILAKVDLTNFHDTRKKVGKILSSLSVSEKRFGWTVINLLHDELKAEAIQELDRHLHGSKTKSLAVQFSKMRTAIRTSDYSNYEQLNNQVNLDNKIPGWMIFLLKDDLASRFLVLRNYATKTRKQFWMQSNIKVKAAFMPALKFAFRISG